MSDMQAVAAPPGESRLQILDALERAAFTASFTRITRAAFELRSAEAAHDQVLQAYLARVGLDPQGWAANPRALDQGGLILIPKAPPAAPPPAPEVQASDPPPAAPASPAPQAAPQSPDQLPKTEFGIED